MSSPAVGTFEVTMSPEPPYDADATASIGRVSIKKQFTWRLCLPQLRSRT